MRYTRTPITSGFETQSQINNNFADIETAINDTLSRAGDSPNFLETDIDFNGHKIYNLPAPSSSTEPLRLGDLPLLDFSSANLPALSGSTADKVLTNDGASLGWSLAKKVVNSISDLTAIPVTQIQNGVVYGTKYHTSSAAGGQAEYEYSSTSTATVNNVTVINAAGGVGRWLLKYNGVIFDRQGGCRNDGSTNDATTLQNIADALASAGGGILMRTPGTSIMNSGVTFAANVELHLMSGHISDMSSAPAQTQLYSWSGTEDTQYSLTANATKGLDTLTISSANLIASGIAANDWVRVRSNAVFDSTRTNSKIGEMIRVESVNTGTGVITFYTGLADSYTTATSATVNKVNFLEGAAVTGFGKIKSRQTPADLHRAIKFSLCYKPKVTGIKIDGMSNIGIWMKDSIFFQVHMVHTQDFNSSSTAYGISVDNACQDGVITQFHGEKVRHLFTTSNSTDTNGIPRRIIMNGFSARNSAPASGGSGGDAVDTHAAAEDIHLWNGVIQWPTSQGVNMECRSGSVSNVYVYGAVDSGIGIHNEADRPGDFVVINSHAFNCGGNGIYVTGPAGASLADPCYERLIVDDCSGTDCVGIGAYIKGRSLTNPARGVQISNLNALRCQSVSAAIYLESIDGLNASNLTARDMTATGTAGVRLRDVKNGRLSGAQVRLPSGSTGIAVYCNGSGAGNLSDVLIDGVVVESPTPSNSRGILVDNNCTGVNIGPNTDLDQCTQKISWGTGTGHRGGYLSGSTTYDPPSLADGAGTTTTVTVSGAALGDMATASFDLSLQGITVNAYVSATNTVSVRFQNESGGVLDLASGTLRAQVWKVN